MRIIAGAYKGRRLAAPTWPGLRPTSDKLRETLFNILAPRIEGARVLDGFAGTGALGMEALSRGAREVVFVEQSPRAAALIAENLRRCGVERAYAIMRGAFERVLARLASDVQFDLILLDPPYDLSDPVRPDAGAARADRVSRRGSVVAAEASVSGLLAVAGSRLAPGGLVVFEHARRREMPPRAGRLALVRQVPSGDSALAFYAVEDARPPGQGSGANAQDSR